MTPTNQLSTHKVIANGNQTRSPANMYFLIFMDDKRFNGKHKTAHTRSPKLQAYPF
jgi:hypothetical protein